MFKITITTLSLLLFGLAAQAGSSSILDELDEVKIKMGKIKLGKSSGLILSPVIESKENGVSKTYSRHELTQLQPFINQFLFDDDIPSKSVGLGNFLPKVEAEFVRQFDSHGAALNIIKTGHYTTSNVPFTAEKLKKKMKATDYFRLKIPLAFKLNLNVAKGLKLVTAGFIGDVFLYADFQYEIYKISKDKVAVRVSTLNEKGRTLNFVIRPNHGSYLNSKIEKRVFKRFFPKQYLNIGLADTRIGQRNSVEYLYDLSDPRAIDAYNELMPSWSDVKLINPFQQKKNKTVMRKLFGKLKKSESLSNKVNSPVKPISMAMLDFDSVKSGIQFDIAILSYKQSTTFSEQYLKIRDNSGKTGLYRIASLTRDFKANALGNVVELDKRKQVNVLFKTDANKEIKELVDINFNLTREDNVLTPNEASRNRGNINRILPKYLHDKYHIQNEHLSIWRKNNFEFMYSINSKTLATLSSRFNQKDFRSIRSEVRKIVDDYLYSLTADYLDQSLLKYYGSIDILAPNHIMEQSELGVFDYGEYEINQTLDPYKNQIADSLATILYHKATADQKWKTFKALKGNQLFVEIGSGIISRVLADKGLGFSKVSLVVESRNKPELVIEDVADNYDPLYYEVIRERNRAISRSFDFKYFDALKKYY